MPAILGINLNPRHEAARPDVDELPRVGWARFVAQLDRNADVVAPEVVQYIGELRAAGIKSLVILARESFRSFDPSPDEQRRIASIYAQTIQPDAFQIGNEPDGGWDHGQTPDHARNRATSRHDRAPSSWCMEPADFRALLFSCHDAIRPHQPNVLLVAGGQCSGFPGFLDLVGDLSTVNAIGIHPYGQLPPNGSGNFVLLPGQFGVIDNLLRGYERFDRPLWITEIGVNQAGPQQIVGEILAKLEADRSPEEVAALQETTEAFQARFCNVMLSHLRDHGDALRVETAFWFCWSDEQNDERFGLVRNRHVNSKKAAFDSFPA